MKGEAKWLLIDGYEDEPAAFGVPPYIGFHVRYVAGVFESNDIPYEYVTIDQWREYNRKAESPSEIIANIGISELLGTVLIAGAIVPGKYLRGTPISHRETRELIATLPRLLPILAGGWAIRGWRQQGWNPLRQNLFLCVQDLDATLDNYLNSNNWKNKRRTDEQWGKWSLAGASSKAVTEHPDLNGPLTYEVEVYQGCVRYKNGCKFCIEPKKGVPLDRPVDSILAEVKTALDAGATHFRLGGMTDVYTYYAEGVKEMEYPIPNPEPISKLLYGMREDERMDILHTDNANPSIIAENLEPSTEITKVLCETLSDGSVLSFGLESADPIVHKENWLNCSNQQLKTAVHHINQYGRGRGKRGLPKLLPGLNFIAGLNGESSNSYNLNKKLLSELKQDGMWLRRINIRQVEGEGFQKVNEEDFKHFKTWVRDEIDGPLLKELFPIGQTLRRVTWESHETRTRLPRHLDESLQSPEIHGKSGISFGRQIGAYPILVGVPYLIPLESESDIIVTGHGKRSISAVEVGIDINLCSQKQLQAIPGIGENAAWKIISKRAQKIAKSGNLYPFESPEQALTSAGLQSKEISNLMKYFSE